MKRVLNLALLFMLFTVVSASAQSRVGKWRGEVKLDKYMEQATGVDGSNAGVDCYVTFNADGTAISESKLEMSFPLDEEIVLMCSVKVEAGMEWSLEGNELTEKNDDFFRYTLEDIKAEPTSMEVEMMLPYLKQIMQSQLDESANPAAGQTRVCIVEFISDDEFSYYAGKVVLPNGEEVDSPTYRFVRVEE